MNINKIKLYITHKYGLKHFILIFIYPIILPFIMIRDTGLSLIAIIKRLEQGGWKYLSGNDRKNGYNNLFYYSQDVAIQESGRYGITSYFNGGNFSLARLFHLTPVSLHFQASFGTVFMMFIAMLVWMFSWVVLYGVSWYLMCLLFLVLFSSLFYACFIEIQNYNILGWMLYPVLLHSLSQGDIINATIIIFSIASLSFTATVIVIPFVLVFAYSYPLLLLSLIPGILKIMIPILKSGHLRDTLAIINGGKKAKYNRDHNKKINLKKLYLFVMFGQFPIVCYWINGFDELSIIAIGTVILFLINETYIRIFDQQSYYILHLSVGTFVLINSQINFVLLVSFGLSIYLVYRWLLNVRTSKFLTPGIRIPFNVQSEIEALRSFFSEVPSGDKIIMAYNNPQGMYRNIFNGYRVFNEPIQYAACLNGLRFMPDWYTVLLNNEFVSKENFWIENTDQAYSYMAEQGISFIIVPEFIEFNMEDDRFQIIKEYTFPIPSKPYKISLFKKV